MQVCLWCLLDYTRVESELCHCISRKTVVPVLLVEHSHTWAVDCEKETSGLKIAALRHHCFQFEV